MNRLTYIAVTIGFASIGHVGQVTDDEKIVASSMLAFIADTSGAAQPYGKGQVVLVWPDWYPKGRTSFNDALAALRDPMFRKQTSSEEKEFRKLSGLTGNWKPTAAPHLKSMSLDHRVVVGEIAPGNEEEFPGWTPGKRRVKERGQRRTIRVPLDLQAPGYSADGNYAVLRAEAPFSMHNSNIYFFLKRSTAGWKVFKIVPIYHL